MNSFDINEAMEVWESYHGPTKHKLISLIDRKIKFIKSIEEKGTDMTERQLNFIKGETDFIDTLLYFMQLEDEKMTKINKAVDDFVKSNEASIVDGAILRQKLNGQSELIKTLIESQKLITEFYESRRLKEKA